MKFYFLAISSSLLLGAALSAIQPGNFYFGWLLFSFLLDKTMLTPEDLRDDPLRMDFGGDHRKRIAFGQVPGVPGELSLDVRQEPRRSKDLQGLLPVQHQSDQGVETDKVIDVGMGHKSVGDLQKLSRTKGPDLPNIKD